MKGETREMPKFTKGIVAMLLSVCVLSTGMVANAAENYTVKEDDYLKKIAKTIYGDESKWETIYEANKNVIKNPNLIYVGQVLVIPDVETGVVPVAETEEQNAEVKAQENTETAIQTVNESGRTLTVTVWHDGDTVDKLYWRFNPNDEWELAATNVGGGDGCSAVMTVNGYIGLKKVIGGKEYVMEQNIKEGTNMDWWFGYSESVSEYDNPGQPSELVIFSSNSFSSIEWH